MSEKQMVTRHGSAFPRRNCIDLYCPAEKAIAEARDVVERAGAHPWLTDAVILLNQAQEKVADWYEQVEVKTAPFGFVIKGAFPDGTAAFYVRAGADDSGADHSQWSEDEKMAKHFRTRTDADRYWKPGSEVVAASVAELPR